jgi:hypothetical protein
LPLTELRLPAGQARPPADVRAFLREAERRVARFRRRGRAPAFVPSDFTLAYGALRALEAAARAPGGLFCEWGSGFGVVPCLAAMLDVVRAGGLEQRPATTRRCDVTHNNDVKRPRPSGWHGRSDQQEGLPSRGLSLPAAFRPARHGQAGALGAASGPA